MANYFTTQLIIIPLLLAASMVCAEWHSAAEDIMGTRISVELWHQDKKVATDAIGAVMVDMRTVDAAMSPYIKSSELYKVNKKAATEAVVISTELFSLIEKSLFYSVVSKGAFDISFASVGRFYNYRKRQAPDEQQLAENLPAINYTLIELNKKNQSIHFKHPQLKIDLGGIAKGYAVDRSIELLKKMRIGSAIVSAGGDSRILGDRRGDPWMIAVRHPRKADDYIVRIPLIDTAISTSGDYERFYMKGDLRVHHILNPVTAKSVGHIQSVSILAPLAVDSDALSTTVFVLGVKPGLALINNMQGIDGLIVDGDGRLHYSDGLLRVEKQ
jgi:FAD:protein FMN transferase